MKIKRFSSVLSLVLSVIIMIGLLPAPALAGPSSSRQSEPGEVRPAFTPENDPLLAAAPEEIHPDLESAISDNGLINTKITPDNNPLPAFRWSEISDAAYYEVKIDSSEWVNVGKKLTYIQPTVLSKGTHSFNFRFRTVQGNAGGGFGFDFKVSVEADLANTKIAYCREGMDIYLMDPDFSHQSRITTNAAVDRHPDWSPDGSKLAFYSDRDGNEEIYVVKIAAKEETRITYNTASDLAPDWSPDGKKIAFSSTRDGNSEIYIMNANGSSQQRITNNTCDDANPSWSPDGSKIAFQTNRDGHYEIYQVDLNSLIETKLSNAPAGSNGYLEPSWSPDGIFIGMNTTRVNGHDTYILDTTDSSITGLITGTSEETGSISWAPDGSKVVFDYDEYEGKNWTLATLNLDGSGKSVLQSPRPQQESAWSPFLFTAVSPRVEAFSADKNSAMPGEAIRFSYQVSDTAGSGLKQVELWEATDTDDDGQPDWPQGNTDYIALQLLSGSTASGYLDYGPEETGTHWYGLHVLDNNGNINYETNSETNYLPGVFGPLEILVYDQDSSGVVAVKNLKVEGTPISGYGNLQVSFEVHNLVPGTSLIPEVTVYLSEDTVRDNGDVALWGPRTITEMAGDEACRFVSNVLALPAGISPGETRYIIAEAKEESADPGYPLSETPNDIAGGGSSGGGGGGGTISRLYKPIEISDEVELVVAFPPQPGDILYKTGELDWWQQVMLDSIAGNIVYQNDSALAEAQFGSWKPGHTGIYSHYDRNKKKHVVIEAIGIGVQAREYDSIEGFGRDDIYMGARTISGGLSDEQRVDILNTAENAINLGNYAYDAFTGVAEGHGLGYGYESKGPNSGSNGYTCVGLAEHAYELAGKNIIAQDQEISWPVALSPLKQFRGTVPVSELTAVPGKTVDFAVYGVYHGKRIDTQPAFSGNLPGQKSLNKDRFIWEVPSDAQGDYEVTFSLDLFADVKTKQVVTIHVEQPWSFAMITDLHIGRGYDNYQGEDYYLTQRLNNAVDQILNLDPVPKFVAVLGDISESGQLPEFEKARGILNKLNDPDNDPATGDGIPYIPILGNHDTHKKYDSRLYFNRTFWLDDAAQKNKNLLVELFGNQIKDEGSLIDLSQNYTFTYDNVKFIVLDTSVGQSSIPSYNENTKTYLKNNLADAGNKPVIILSHIPPVHFSNISGSPKYVLASKTSGTGYTDYYGFLDLITSGYDVMGWFSGHIHGFDDMEIVQTDLYIDANYDEWSSGVLAFKNFPVVTTEALMVGQNEVGKDDDKQVIRLVTVFPDNIDYNSWAGQTPALNPRFDYSNVGLSQIPDGYQFFAQQFTNRTITSWKWNMGFLGFKEGPSVYIARSELLNAVENGKVALPVQLEVTDSENNTERIQQIVEISTGPAWFVSTSQSIVPMSNRTTQDLTVTTENRNGVPVLINVTHSPAKPVAKININFGQATANIDLTNLTADYDLSAKKSFFHLDTWPVEVETAKTLFIPSSGTGRVYICPLAESLDDVVPENAAVWLNTGETREGMTLSTTTYDGLEYYVVSGVTGTGGGETYSTDLQTATALTSSANHTVSGQTITLTATVSADSGTPTGQVYFKEGEIILGTADLSGSSPDEASLTFNQLTIGTHLIIAEYGGEAGFNGSVSPEIIQIVAKASVTVDVASSLNPSVLGTPVTLSGAVSAVPPGSGIPGGLVVIKDGELELITLTLNKSGQAVYTTSDLAAGEHSISAVYSGDAGFEGAISELLVQVVYPDTLYITTGSLGDGDAKAPYLKTLQVINGVPPYTWSVLKGDRLPSGLSLKANKPDGSTAALSGKPSKAEDYTFTLQVTDKNKNTATRQYTLHVNQAVAMKAPVLSTAEVGVAFTSSTPAASGGNGGYTWSIKGLPPGLDIDSSGTILGTPQASGTFRSIITVKDNLGGAASKNFTLKVLKRLTITTTEIPDGDAGLAYNTTTLKATGGTGKYTWYLEGGWPSGLTLSSKGVLKGTLAAESSGGYKLGIRVEDGIGKFTQNYAAIIYPALEIDPLSAGFINHSYKHVLSANGGSRGYTFRLSGVLPKGLKFSSKTGAISGTPAKAGSYPLKIKVTDSIKGSITRTLTLIVYSEVQTLKIGMITPSTGPAAARGKPAEDAIKDAVEYINSERNGVLGYPIQLSWKDSGYDAAAVATIVNEFINEGDLLFTTLSSKEMTAAMNVANAAGFPGLVTLPAAGNIDPPQHIYTHVPGYGDDWVAFVEYYLKYFWEGPGKPKMALHLLNNTTGSEVKDAANAQAAALGIDIVAIEEHAANTISEIESLTRIMAQNPDILYIGSTPGPTSVILKSAKDLGLLNSKIVIGVGQAAFSESLIELAGADLVEGVYGVYPTVAWDEGFPFMETIKKYVLKNHPEDYGNMDYLRSWCTCLVAAEILKNAVENVSYDTLKKGDAGAWQAIEQYGIRKLGYYDVEGLQGRVYYTPGSNQLCTILRIYRITGGEVTLVEGWLPKPQP